MIIGAMFGIHFKSSAKNGIEGIHTYTALKTATGFLPQQPLHFNFIYQVGCTLVEVGKTIDFFPGQIGRNCH